MEYLIPLTQGKFAKVDADDFERLSVFKWHYHKNASDLTGYARRWAPGERHPRRCIYMHIEISGIVGVDHVNRDPLDNRKENLRPATRSQQVYNRKVLKSNVTSRLKGVSFVRDRNGVPAYCIARITANKERVYLGVFPDAETAARAYDEAAKKLHGEYACLNFPS